MRAALLWTLGIGLAGLATETVLADEPAPEEVVLVPGDPAGWGLRNVAAAVTSVFGAWSYWYGENEVLIESVPARSVVHLFYVRANFQKAFVRASSPVRVRLPSRIHATPRDSLQVRVSAPGFRTWEVSHRVGDVPEHLVARLEALPNSLIALGNTHLAGRTTLSLRTTEKPEFRVMRSRGTAGFTLILVETANRLEPDRSASGGLVRRTEATQVGEDLVLRVETTEVEPEVRSRASYDPIREEHLFSLELSRQNTRLPAPSEIRAEMERVAFDPGDRCELRFEQALRDALEPETLERGFRASGALVDLYRREAMLRLGRADHGRVQTLDGRRIRTGSPIELEASLQEGAVVRGYVALLGAYARSSEEPEIVARSLLTPDLAPEEFERAYRSAEETRRRCRGSRPH